ncbi:MAG: hypothetical protein FWD80_03845 [Propionibacteriaceae bacterium]|nr:hypothetical protein [Propionibacteriaceae bacterium]
MFEYKAATGKVFISWDHRVVVTLAGNDAARFLQRIAGADDASAQLVMAKATGNFRRGNEKSAGTTTRQR